MAGRSSLTMKARELGLDLDEKRPEMKGLIEELKEREFRGYEYEARRVFQAARREVSRATKTFFEVRKLSRYHRAARRRIVAEATVKLKVKRRAGAHRGGRERADRGARQGAAPRIGKTYPQLRR